MLLPITFLLLCTRIGCLIMTAPILGSRSVPLKFRLLLAGLISLAALPLATALPASSSVAWSQPTVGVIFTAVLSEIVIGILLGLGVTILFSAAAAAGAVIGQLAGVQWPTQDDLDSGESVSAVGQLFGMLSLATFALINGPELVIGSVLETCVHLPLGTSLNPSSVIGLLTELLQQSLMLTLRGVGPAVAALMISTIVIGLIGRAYPQLNVLSMGLNSNQLVLFLAIFLTMGGCVWLFVDDLGQFLALIQTRLRGMV